MVTLSMPANIMSMNELKEHKKLQKQLMGDNMFVEVGDSPEWQRFNELNRKYCDFMLYIKGLNNKIQK